MNNYYDHIVYGASFSGIVYALKQAGKGKSVLLLNKYGFSGGSITEALNCLQYRTSVTEDTLSGSILKKLRSERFYSFFDSGDKMILNPEAVKIVLQKEIEASGIDTLFHVLPCGIITQNESLLLNLLGKEGEIKLECGCLFDAEGEYYLDFLAGSERKVTEAALFCFVSEKYGNNLPLHPVTEQHQLNDGRIWLKMNLTDYSPDFVETRAQEIINSFTRDNPGVRIQLLPARSYLHYEPVAEMESPVLSAERITGRKFNNSEELLKAAELEEKMP